MQTIHNKHKKRILIYLGIAGLTAASLNAATDAEISALRSQIAALDAKVRELVSSQEAEAKATADNAKNQPVITVGQSGFRLESNDKNWSIRIRGNVQADYRYYVDDGGVNNNDKFLLRRVRPNFEAKLGERVSFRVMPDFAGANTSLLDAYGVVHFSPAFNILAGKAKSPFSLERLVSQTNLSLIERAFPTSLGPNRDIGVHFFGKLLDGKVDYTFAVLAGAQNNGSVVTDPDDNPEIAARIFSHPFRSDEGSFLQGLGIGYAITHGKQENVAPSNLNTPGQQAGFRYLAGSLADGNHTRHAPQAYWYYGSFGLLTEYTISDQEVSNGGVTEKLKHRGWQVLANWVLTGEKASYGAIAPKNAFDLSNGHWGAWELSARVQELKIDDDAFPVFASRAQSFSRATAYGVGVNWYLTRNLKASVLLEHTEFRDGAAGGADKRDEDIIFSRLQFHF